MTIDDLTRLRAKRDQAHTDLVAALTAAITRPDTAIFPHDTARLAAWAARSAA